MRKLRRRDRAEGSIAANRHFPARLYGRTRHRQSELMRWVTRHCDRKAITLECALDRESGTGGPPSRRRIGRKRNKARSEQSERRTGDANNQCSAHRIVSETPTRCPMSRLRQAIPPARFKTCMPAAWFRETLVSDSRPRDHRAHRCVMNRSAHPLGDKWRNQTACRALLWGPAILSPLPPVLGRSSWAQPLDRIGCALIFSPVGPRPRAKHRRHLTALAQGDRIRDRNYFR
jgi:hypothetical protein